MVVERNAQITSYLDWTPGHAKRSIFACRKKNKPENPFQTMTSLKIGKIYIMSKEISQYDYQKYKNRKPDKKPDPDQLENFRSKSTSISR